jgi:hypothetical protein
MMTDGKGIPVAITPVQVGKFIALMLSLRDGFVQDSTFGSCERELMPCSTSLPAPPCCIHSPCFDHQIRMYFNDLSDISLDSC